MMNGLILHTFKGVNGWSTCNHSIIDVAKIKSIKYNKRLFTFFQKEYKYTLKINYKENNSNIGIIRENSYDSTLYTQLITKRYKTINDVNDEITEIKKKQDRLQRRYNNIKKKMK